MFLGRYLNATPQKITELNFFTVYLETFLLVLKFHTIKHTFIIIIYKSNPRKYLI